MDVSGAKVIMWRRVKFLLENGGERNTIEFVKKMLTSSSVEKNNKGRD